MTRKNKMPNPCDWDNLIFNEFTIWVFTIFIFAFVFWVLPYVFVVIKFVVQNVLGFYVDHWTTVLNLTPSNESISSYVNDTLSNSVGALR